MSNWTNPKAKELYARIKALHLLVPLLTVYGYSDQSLVVLASHDPKGISAYHEALKEFGTTVETRHIGHILRIEGIPLTHEEMYLFDTLIWST